MGVTLRADGWHDITPTEPSGEGEGHTDVNTSRLIYVDSNAADDSGDGSQANPKKTIAAGLALLRSGSPDHLYLRRSRDWTNETIGTITLQGKSETELILISAYGPAAETRPRLKTAIGQTGIGCQGALTNGSNFAVTSIEFYCYERNPNDPDYDPANLNTDCFAMNCVTPATGQLFEDLKFTYYSQMQVNVSIGGIGSRVKFHRNIVAYEYASFDDPDAHSGGLFFDQCSDFQIDECIMYANGYIDFLGQSTVTIDIGSPTVVHWPGHTLVDTDTVAFSTTGALPTGITAAPIVQGMAITGRYKVVNANQGAGTFEIANKREPPLTDGIINTTGTQSGVHTATWYRSRDQYDHHIYLTFDNPGQASIRGCLLVRPAAHGIQCRNGGTIVDCFVAYAGEGILVGKSPSKVEWCVIMHGSDCGPRVPDNETRGTGITVGTQGSDTVVRYNIISKNETIDPVNSFAATVINGNKRVLVTDNIAYDWDSGSNPVFGDQDGSNTFARNDPNGGVGYPDPDRTLAQYNQLFGTGTASADDFMIYAVENQRRGNWNEVYTASAVNKWIREGFGLTMVGNPYRVRLTV